MDFYERFRQFKRGRWGHLLNNRLISAAAVVVVFVTTYMLILPAITQTTDIYCGLEEHSHSDACYATERVLTCTLEESEGHTHSEECYVTVSELTCGQEESQGHTHGDGCYEVRTTLTCTNEYEDHVHDESCYTSETVLTCQLAESEGHTHTDACYSESRELSCGLEESEGHTHTDACYSKEEVLTCTEEEHEHTASCYSNPNADLESEESWTNTFKNVELTGKWSDDVIAIAETQIGYEESTRNYIVNEDGDKKGYTRYGSWYGNPYGDWCAMFAAFCQHYAEVDSDLMPYSASCETWIQMLSGNYGSTDSEKAKYSQYDLYHDYNEVFDGTYTIKPGDLVFFNWDSEDDADHVGIIYKLITEEDADGNEKVTGFTTIEGNCSDAVKTKDYDLDYSKIKGYGELPENPDYEEPENEVEEAESLEGTEEPEITETETEEAGSEALETESQEDVSETRPASNGNLVEKADGEVEITEDIEETTEDIEKQEEIVQETEPTETAEADVDTSDSVRLINHSACAVIYTDSYYKELSDDQTVIMVRGNLPEKAYVNAYPAYVDKNDFADGITVLRAYDITIFNEDGSTFEPTDGNTVSVNIEIPGLEDMADLDSVSIYYVPTEGEPEEIKAEAAEEMISFNAGHFSTYAVTADTADNTITVNGVTYTALPNPTQTVTTTNSDKVVMLNTGSFGYKLDFTLDNTQTTDHYYIQLPQYAVLQEVDNEPIKDAAGNTLATYTINNVDADGDGLADTSYILITPATAATQMSGSISANGSATREGQIIFSNGEYIYVIPADSNYNDLQTSKSTTSQKKNDDGSYTFTHTITIKNKGNTPIENLWFVDEARTSTNNSYTLTITGPVSTDTSAPAFTKVTDTGDTSIYKTGYEYYSLGSKEDPVTIPANTTYTYTATSTISAEDFAKIEAASTATTSSSDSIVTVYDDTRLNTTTTWFSYYPASLVMSKTALTAGIDDDSTVIPWEIAFNTSSRLENSSVVITDTIKENAYATDEGGIHYLTDYPATATIEYYGNAQTTIQLTWVEVEDLDNIENPDGEHIYYCGNSFKYFPSLYSGWHDRYGVVLKYYTNYNKQVSATDNEAQANFVDKTGGSGTTGTIEGSFDSRVQLNKMLDAQNDDNTATWTVTSSVNSTSDLTACFLDKMPYQSIANASTFEKLINDAKIYANDQVDADANAAYILFDSVAQFEAVTGIKVTVTDRKTGALLDKEDILCGGNVSYAIQARGKTYDESDTKKLLFVYDTRTVNSSNYSASFMIVPNIPASAAESYLNDAEYKKVTTTGFLPSNEKAGTEEGYNITFTYTTDTSGAADGETRRNTIKQEGKVTETVDDYNLSAQAYYIKSGDESIKQIDKNIARAVLQDDGSYKLTYVVLIDNRGNSSTSINTLQWRDAISGIDGAQYVQGSLDVYIPYVSYDSDSKAWNIATYSSLDEIEAAAQAGYPLPIISDSAYVSYGEDGFGSGESFDLTELLTYSESASGFRFTMNLRRLLDGYKSTYKYQNSILRNYSVPGNTSSSFCWQSFYLVYDVTVPASKVSSGTLTNKITRYVDGTADISASNQYSMGMKELQKKETQHADSSNDYYTRYELDVTMSEKLKVLESFTVQDTMSDSLSMDINSMVVTAVNGDTMTTLTSGDYTVRYANGALTLVFNKPTDGWPDSYRITYGATVIGEGPVSYTNSALIPEIGSVPQYTESSTYIKDEEISAKQVTLNIQKYDGDNISRGGLDGAEFVLERLTSAAQQALLAQGITDKAAMDSYLTGLPDSSWTTTNVPQPVATGTAGEFTLTSSTEEAIYSNVVYRLRETTAPAGFVFENVHRYFMIYSSTADATQTGITAKEAYRYIYPYVDQKNYVISYQIPNYQVNFNVYKTDQDGEDLTGAVFTLYTDAACTNALKNSIPTKDNDGRTCYNFPKLGAGTYYLKETKAPSGYYLNETVVKVTVTVNGDITFTDAKGKALINETDTGYSSDGTTLYLNKDNKLIYVDELITYNLPKTGGMGTTPFTIAGLLLMAGAAFLAVLKYKGKTGKL